MIRTALIGCGAVAESGHLPTLRRDPRFAIAAVADVRPERAEHLSAMAENAPAYRDWRELLERETIDAAVLALPPEASPDVAIECLDRGIPVLDEKPLAANLDDGRRVARAVARTSGVYQVGFVLRYGDWAAEIARRARAIGRPSRTRVAVFDERLDPSDVEHLERIQGFLRRSSAMVHEGSHVIDYAALWNSSPWKRASASAERTAPFLDGPNVWHARIDLEDGSELEVEIGWLLSELPPCRVTLEGPHGELEFSPATGAGHWRASGETGTLLLPPLAPEWGRQYDVFARAIAHGRAETATVADGLRALEVTVACEQSARTGSPVERGGSR